MKYDTHTALACLVSASLTADTWLDWALRIVALLLPLAVALIRARRRPRRNRRARAPINAITKTAALIVASTFLVVFVSGCNATMPPAMIEALSHDTNHIDLHITSPWGSVDFKRN